MKLRFFIIRLLLRHEINSLHETRSNLLFNKKTKDDYLMGYELGKKSGIEHAMYKLLNMNL